MSQYWSQFYSCFLAQEEPESLWASASRYKHRSHRRQTVRSTDLRQTEPKDLQKHCMKLEQESSQRSYNWLINRQSESTDRLMSFNTLRRAVSVLCWALKPDWNAWLIFYWEIGEHRWIWTHFFKLRSDCWKQNPDSRACTWCLSKSLNDKDRGDTSLSFN